jgi:hypothetical protein
MQHDVRCVHLERQSRCGLKVLRKRRSPDEPDRTGEGHRLLDDGVFGVERWQHAPLTRWDGMDQALDYVSWRRCHIAHFSLSGAHAP